MNLEDAANQIVSSRVDSAALSVPGRQPRLEVPKEWPQFGRIVFDRVSCRYRKDLPSVLQDVSFVVEPGERVALCGRTGAGKSSAVLAMFRFISCESGHISIDDMDIARLSLGDLRSSMSILPQDPVRSVHGYAVVTCLQSCIS